MGGSRGPRTWRPQAFVFIFVGYCWKTIVLKRPDHRRKNRKEVGGNVFAHISHLPGSCFTDPSQKTRKNLNDIYGKEVVFTMKRDPCRPGYVATNIRDCKESDYTMIPQIS